MSHLLYVESSPRKQRSASIEVAQTFLAAYQDTHPEVLIDTLDVWSTPLPEFNGAVLEAKYAGINGVPLSAEQSDAWLPCARWQHAFNAPHVSSSAYRCGISASPTNSSISSIA